MGNIVSLLGDWFNTIALYHLIAQLTGSPLAMGGVFLFKLLPWGLVSPLAGVIVDRFNRRQVMIISDLLRAVVVLGFLLVETPSQVPLVYLLIALQVIIGSVFNPAKSASVPNITTPRELLTANALSSATWSVMLALGAGLGGIATEFLGTDAVFILDSLTYLVSAVFIYRTVIPQETDKPTDTANPIADAFRAIVEGARYMLKYPRIGKIALAKTTWAIGGGAMVYMLTLLGQEVLPNLAAFGIGLLFLIRGLGTGIGPIIARSAFTNQDRWPGLLGLFVATSGVFYLTLGFATATWVICLAVLLAHAASGANWVLATVILQQESADQLRGRVFAFEWLMVLVTESASILAASLLLESDLLTLREAFFLFAGLQVLSGLAWMLAIAHPFSPRGND